MSYNLRNIREISNDPLTKFTNEIAKKLSRFLTKDSIDQLEDQEDIYSDGQDIDTVVKFHDELEFTNKFDTTTLYYPPLEPDGDKLKLWLRGRNMGNTIMDKSLFNRNGTINGDPLLIDGTPFNNGINVGGGGIRSTALRFNRPTSDFVNEEDIRVPDAAALFVADVTGNSWFIRFKLTSIEEQSSFSRHLFEKIDDSTPDAGIRVYVTNDGRLVARIKRGGTQYNNQTATNTIAVDTVYDVWITYALSGNVVHIYVNNVDKTLTDPGTSSSWHTPLSNHDLAIFSRGGGSTGGHAEGNLYDFRIYKEKVVSSTEIGYFNTNKWTIADVPYGQVMIADYFASNP